MSKSTSVIVDDLITQRDLLLQALEGALEKMEYDEVMIDGEWGGCRDIETIEQHGELPEEIINARAAISIVRGSMQ